MKKNLILFCLLALTLASCTKQLDDQFENNGQQDPISEVPEIELLSVSSDEVVAYEDAITFKIKYVDGDGDLGTDDPDIHSIELVDNRNTDLFVFEYHLSPRTPDGSELVIQGELDIVLDNTIMLDENSSSETTTFSIRLKDRAGNWSNVVETGEVVITN